MANGSENIVKRSFAAILRTLGVETSGEIPDAGKKSPADALNYGTFAVDELRHMEGISEKVTGKPPMGKQPREEDIGTYLEQVSSSTHSKIEEIRNLGCVAPELKVASRVIVSTILSPTHLNTNTINITMDYEGISTDVKNQILKLLNDHFNNEYHLAQKLAKWLRTAGFKEGSKPIIVLPKHELDVQNAIQDVLASNENLSVEDRKKLNDELKTAREVCSCEDLAVEFHSKSERNRVIKTKDDFDMTAAELAVENEISAALEGFNMEEFWKNHSSGFTEPGSEDNKGATIKTTEDLVESLKKGTFKLLRHNGDGTVVVTRDLNHVAKGARHNSDVLSQLLADAKKQFVGFDPEAADGATSKMGVRSFTISDDIKVGENDLPIVIELPADSVIPVCAPRDPTNHIGYFVLIDDNGQPLSGKINTFNTGSTDTTNRLAMSAARGVYGSATLTSFNELSSSPEFVLQQMTNVFTVAVNKLLESKLSKTGLTGLHVDVHSAVGKSLFMNLLAKNKIKMVFVPEPMMVYYRFDHRDDGTGKTLLEDVGQMLALRTTLMVARLMAVVENATQHRNIEVDVDEKDNNPLQTIQMVVRQALAKYSPSFNTDVQTCAEAMINRNITVKPKSIAGTTDNLSVNIEKSYGNAQAPDTDIMDKLNNWIGMGIGGIPASVLNQLGENEFSRSVATTNMYFSNQVNEWQDLIRPYNKKFVTLYVGCNARLVKSIREILGSDKKAKPEGAAKNKSPDVKDEKLEKQLRDIIASINIDLPTPVMAAKKADYEDITAFTEMVSKLNEVIYSDDIVVDDELKGNMNTIRAAILSKTLREFLPKLGCQAIADIPEPSNIDASYAKDTWAFLSNLRRRLKNLADASKGSLPKTAAEAGVSSEGDNPEGDTGF